MFKRAGVSLSLAALTGLPAYLGLLNEWELGGKIASGCFFAFCVVSFLLGMFEEPAESVAIKKPENESVAVSGMQLIRVAP